MLTTTLVTVIGCVAVMIQMSFKISVVVTGLTSVTKWQQAGAVGAEAD